MYLTLAFAISNSFVPLCITHPNVYTRENTRVALLPPPPSVHLLSSSCHISLVYILLPVMSFSPRATVKREEYQAIHSETSHTNRVISEFSLSISLVRFIYLYSMNSARVKATTTNKRDVLLHQSSIHLRRFNI